MARWASSDNGRRRCFASRCKSSGSQMFTLGMRTSYVRPGGLARRRQARPPFPASTASPRTWDRYGPSEPRAQREGFAPQQLLIGPLRRSWALCEERIILASALMRHLRKHIDAQRLALSTCKAGALPAELRPHALMSIVLY